MSRQVVDLFISFVKQYGDKVFDKEPEEAVNEVMGNVRRYGEFVKYYIRMYWSDLEKLFKDPQLLLNEVKNVDQEVYNKLTQHLDWVYKFMDKLYVELKNYLG